MYLIFRVKLYQILNVTDTAKIVGFRLSSISSSVTVRTTKLSNYCRLLLPMNAAMIVIYN